MNETKKIKKLIDKKIIVTMPLLRTELEGRSRCSVFRDLLGLGHISSFTHAGEYFTLPNIPKFNADGIWFFGDVGFSIHGTLKNTVQHSVNAAIAGLTHDDLEKIFRVRLHNVLLDLIRLNKITRQILDSEKVYLYLSSEKRRSEEQLGRRQAVGPHGALVEKSVTPMMIVQVLVEVIRDFRVVTSAEVIQKRLARKGMIINTAQVVYIFSSNGIGLKKTPHLT